MERRVGSRTRVRRLLSTPRVPDFPNAEVGLGRRLSFGYGSRVSMIEVRVWRGMRNIFLLEWAREMVREDAEGVGDWGGEGWG